MRRRSAPQGVILWDMESLNETPRSPESPPFHIEELSTERVPEYSSDIISIYRQGWMDTYPNEGLGISKGDIASRFENEAALSEEWDKLLRSPDRHTWVATDSGGAVAGFCIAKTGGNENELEYIYLAQDARGKGLGDAFMRKAIAWLGEEKPIALYGASYNAHAMEFYEGFGFRLSDEAVPPKELPNGTRLPSMKMVRAPHPANV